MPLLVESLLVGLATGVYWHVLGFWIPPQDAGESFAIGAVMAVGFLCGAMVT